MEGIYRFDDEENEPKKGQQPIDLSYKKLANSKISINYDNDRPRANTTD